MLLKFWSRKLLSNHFLFAKVFGLYRQEYILSIIEIETTKHLDKPNRLHNNIFVFYFIFYFVFENVMHLNWIQIDVDNNYFI